MPGTFASNILKVPFNLQYTSMRCLLLFHLTEEKIVSESFGIAQVEVEVYKTWPLFLRNSLSIGENIHSFKKYLLSASLMIGTIIDFWNIALDKAH